MIFSGHDRIKNMDRKQLALLWSIISVFSISAYVIVGKMAFVSGVGDAVVFSFQVALIAAAFLFLGAFVKERENVFRVRRKSIKYILLAGLFGGALNYGFSFFGLQHTTAINSSFLSETTLFFTAIFAYFFLREKMKPSKIILIIFLLAGVYLMATGGKNMLLNSGDPFILIAGLSYSAGYVAAKKGLALLPALTFSAYRTLLGGIFLFIYLAAIGGLGAPVYWFWTLVNGAVQALGVFSTYKALEYGTASYASAMTVATTLVTAAAAWFLLGETLNVVQAIGGAIILISVYFVNKADI
jgi:drug/metabolite transporter (DMT)-like permease